MQLVGLCSRDPSDAKKEVQAQLHRSLAQKKGVGEGRGGGMQRVQVGLVGQKRRDKSVEMDRLEKSLSPAIPAHTPRGVEAQMSPWSSVGWCTKKGAREQHSLSAEAVRQKLATVMKRQVTDEAVQLVLEWEHERVRRRGWSACFPCPSMGKYSSMLRYRAANDVMLDWMKCNMIR